MSRKPWLWLLAGPNGAGKSTYSPKFENIPVINTDEIAGKLSPSAPERAAFAAGRRSIALMRQYLRRKKSFAVETTLSGQLHIDAAEKASAEGWRVGLVYIGLASSRLAIERVRQRQLAGGHGVPAADVHRRYERSLRRLPAAYRLADAVLIFDNSEPDPMKKVLEVRSGKIIFLARPAPKWLSRSLRPMRGSRRRV